MNYQMLKEGLQEMGQKMAVGDMMYCDQPKIDLVLNAAIAIERLNDRLADWEAHARVVYDENGTNWGIGGYLCSECNGLCEKGDRFCKHCGAKFDKEENDDSDNAD